MIRVCFHLHSEYSSDSLLSLEKIADEAEKNQINVVIITDHDNLIPPLEAEKIAKVRVIVGEEIKTSEGEIIGIFLKERIVPGLSVAETIKKIKEQKGLVVVPHPFDRFRLEAIERKAFLSNINQIDIIEVFNARNILEADNKKALDFAEKNQKVKIVGSDAHLASEIKNTYIEMENFNGPNDFLIKLKKAKFFTKKTPIWNHFFSTTNKIFKKI